MRALAAVGALVRAFQATGADCDEAACLLRTSTSRRARTGACHTRQWCCSIRALATALVTDDLVPLDLGPVGPVDFLLLLGAREAIGWETAAASPLPPRAHLRVFALEIGVRAGLLLGASGGVPSPLLDSEPAWADLSRRGEPVAKLLASLTGAPHVKAVAKGCNVPERCLHRWRRGLSRPSREHLDRFARYVAGKANARSVLRTLSWHYSLAELTREVTRASDAAFARDLVTTVARVVASSSERARDYLATLPPSLHRPALAVALLDPPAEGVQSLATLYAPTWRDDVDAVLAERGQRTDFFSVRSSADLELVFDRLPRKPPPQRTSRRARLTTQPSDRSTARSPHLQEGPSRGGSGSRPSLDASPSARSPPFRVGARRPGRVRPR